jgi:hypothetical protein
VLYHLGRGVALVDVARLKIGPENVLQHVWHTLQRCAHSRAGLKSRATVKKPAEAGSESFSIILGRTLPHGMPCGYRDRANSRTTEDWRRERASARLTFRVASGLNPTQRKAVPMVAPDCPFDTGLRPTQGASGARVEKPAEGGSVGGAEGGGVRGLDSV